MSTASGAEPCRLFVVLARNAPLALIFRRGPRHWTQLIQWNTQTDSFENGAWFQGRLYPERSDLSPDGTKLIYFAAYSRKSRSSEFPDEWTAISKVPWLTALCVWPNCGTYYGGGLFESETKVSVNQSRESGWSQLWNYGQLPSEIETSCEQPFWDPNWQHLFRLERDGWKSIAPYATGSVPLYLATMVSGHNFYRSLAYPLRVIHEKSSAHGSETLVMTSTYCYGNSNSNEEGQRNGQSFELRDNQDKTVTPIEDATWADWDHRGRLVFAREGKIFTARGGYSDGLQEKELADFNDAKPRRTKSPAWARHW